MTTSRKARSIALANSTDTKSAGYKKFKDRGSYGDSEFYDISQAADEKFGEDYDNTELYGKDAMKGKGFATQGRPQSINAGASRPATQSGTPKGK